MTKAERLIMEYRRASGRATMRAESPEELAYFQGVQIVLESLLKDAGLSDSFHHGEWDAMNQEETWNAEAEIKRTWPVVLDRVELHRASYTGKEV